MVIEFFLLVVLLLVLVSAVSRHIRQVLARTRADRIIAGKEPATEEQLNKCIDRILHTKSLLYGQAESDRVRAARLRDMRKEMVTPHP